MGRARKRAAMTHILQLVLAAMSAGAPVQDCRFNRTIPYLDDAADEKRRMRRERERRDRIIGGAGPAAPSPEGENRANIARTTCAASRSAQMRLVAGRTSSRAERSSVESDESG